MQPDSPPLARRSPETSRSRYHLVGARAPVLALLCALVPAPAPAQDTSDAAVPQAPADPSRGPTDPEELEAFVDGVMEVGLDEFDIAGAVVSIVSGGEIFFQKGYGYSDVEARAPVSPETTLFRIGSTSKLFAWTSVMQMVEAGLLELDEDVNRYLDFEIPEAFDRPVTLSDIMAHAGGFEDHVIGLFGDEPEDVRPLGELLREQTPARVRPPGVISSYSNHATGMAAYAVERASDVEWVEYVEDRILRPLDMRSTTFRQPLPDALASRMSKGYAHRDGRFREEDFEYVPMAPVGGASASGADMARFMIAHLQLGRYGEERILSESTARRMQRVHHRMHPAINGMAHGFIGSDRNGERIIGHGGDTRWFHTGLWLFPDRDLGVFVSFNSGNGAQLRDPFFEGFVDRYFPEDESAIVPPDDFPERAERFAGTYRPNRFSHTTVAKLTALGAVDVRPTDRGTLRVLDEHWIEVAPGAFREEHGSETLVFRESDDGDVTHFLLGSLPIVAFERVPAEEVPKLHFALFALTLATILAVLLSPLAGWVLRRWYEVSVDDQARIPALARLAIRLAAALFAAGLVFLLIAVAAGDIAVEVPRNLRIALVLLLLAALPTLASLLFAIRIWSNRQGRASVRVLYSLAVTVFCLFLWQLSVWNLVGLNY